MSWEAVAVTVRPKASICRVLMKLSSSAVWWVRGGRVRRGEVLRPLADMVEVVDGVGGEVLLGHCVVYIPDS